MQLFSALIGIASVLLVACFRHLSRMVQMVSRSMFLKDGLRKAGACIFDVEPGTVKSRNACRQVNEIIGSLSLRGS